MKNKNIFKINIIYFVAITLVAIVFFFGYSGLLTNDILTSFLIQIVVMFAIPILMYSLLMKKKFKETLADVGFKKISYKMVGISILLGFVLYFINSFVADAFSSIITLLGFESLSTPQITTFNYGTIFKEFILSCLLPGFCEEILHRGIMLHANKKHANTKFCLIISSILFGLSHLNIRQFFYAAILGFLMGCVSLAANSIIPAMIIHFMNNFLSTYLFYGSYLNWPFAKFVRFVTNLFMGDLFVWVSCLTIGVGLLIMLYIYLTKLMLKEQLKNEIHSIVTALQMEKLSLIQAQIRINQVNVLLKNKAIHEQRKTPNSFLDKSFLIAGIVLSTLLTISSFIWGVI